MGCWIAQVAAVAAVAASLACLPAALSCSVSAVHLVPDFPTRITAFRGDTVLITLTAVVDPECNDSQLECSVRYGRCTDERCSRWAATVQRPATLNATSGDAATFSYAFSGTPASYEVTGCCGCNRTHPVWAGDVGRNLAIDVLERGCGNALLEPGEQCDGSALCTANCTCSPGALPLPRGLCTLCGNGVVDAGEQCDTAANCTRNCTCVAGTVPDSAASGCTTCGNGLLDAGEQCDTTYRFDPDCRSCTCVAGEPHPSGLCHQYEGVGATREKVVVAAIVGSVVGLVAVGACVAVAVALVLRRVWPQSTKRQLELVDVSRMADPNSAFTPQSSLAYANPLACGTTTAGCLYGAGLGSTVVLDGCSPVPVLLDRAITPPPALFAAAIRSAAPVYDVESTDIDIALESCGPDVIDPATGSVVLRPNHSGEA
eukprot:m51a1_g9994 putative serine-threonine protein (430) ;mRNA; r:52368-53980